MKFITSRVFFIIVAAIVQFAWVFVAYAFLDNKIKYLSEIVVILSVILILWLVSSKMNPAYKLAWSILIMVVPFFGVVLYILFGRSHFSNMMKKRRTERLGATVYPAEGDGELFEENVSASRFERMQKYIESVSGYPVYAAEDLKYYPLADDAAEDILQSLKTAKKSIYLEYFIIGKGKLWNEIHTILKDRVKSGVDVRLIYDDMGSAGKVPLKYHKKLCAEGIKTVKFNPLFLINSIRANNRDHRKIMLIDGKTAFIGGFNLADEYVNITHPFGHWKDCGLRISGRSVEAFSSMFAEMWHSLTGEDIDLEFGEKCHEYTGKGFIQAYSDNPLDDTFTGQGVCLEMINSAKESVDITTPYFVVDNEIMTAICNAARSGVKVRLITPGIPDKKFVFLTTQSYYRQLLESGVEIYQYTPGFIHSKLIVCDKKMASIGTVNMDFRSLYLHYECGALIYDTPVIEDIEKDFEDTVLISQKVDIDFCDNRSKIILGLQSIMRLFAPMF